MPEVAGTSSYMLYELIMDGTKFAAYVGGVHSPAGTIEIQR